MSEYDDSNLPYCRWCDPDDEDHEYRVYMRDEDWVGTRLHERGDVEHDFCPFCSRKLTW